MTSRKAPATAETTHFTVALVLGRVLADGRLAREGGQNCVLLGVAKGCLSRMLHFVRPHLFF